MSRLRVAALLLLSGAIAAVSCGSDDDRQQTSPEPQAGDSGVPSPVGSSGVGAAPSEGGQGAAAGAPTSPPGAGGAGAPAAGAAQGGEPPQLVGGAGGDRHRGDGGAAGTAGAAGAEMEPALFADDFDAEQLETAGTHSANYVEFAQWDVASGSVDVTVLPNGTVDSPGGYGLGQAAHGVVVDLNGTTLQNGVLETKVPLTFLPNVTYTLRYALGNARNQRNAVTVSINGLVSETRTQTKVSPFTAYETSFTPVVKVTAKLVFTSVGGGDNDGLLLDEVSLRR